MNSARGRWFTILLYGLLPVAAFFSVKLLFRPSTQTVSPVLSETAASNATPPLTFQQTTQFLKDIELSEDETTDLKEWITAGVPRQWKGKLQFPKMTDDEWSAFRKGILSRAEELGVKAPP